MEDTKDGICGCGRVIMKKYKGIAAVLLGVSLIILAGCDLPWGGGSSDMDHMDMMSLMGEDPGINVETTYPVVRTISQSGSYIGTIETGDKVSVTPRVGGYVKEKYFGLGDFVNAGDVLFTIDDTDLQLAKKKAEADVRDANAKLAKDKAENEATKFEVNEALYTLDEKSMENNNNIQKAIRSEYEAQLDLYKACESEGIHKKEGDYLEDLISKDKDAIENAKEFTKKLKGEKSIYDSIAGAATDADARIIAANNGVTVDPAWTKAQCAAGYLTQKTAYDSADDLTKAISSSEAAESSAKSSKAGHESSDRANDLTIISDEVTVQKERGNIATAQEDIALKRKIAADYEIFSKARIWAQQQAKLAAGDASVLSANVSLSKANIDLEIAEAKLRNTSVISPVSGEIVECKIDDFGTCSDSGVAYTIIDTSRKKAVFYVTGDAKNNMAVGQKVVIDKSGTQYNATVDQISDTPDEKKHLYRVTAVISENDMAALDAGTSVRLITSIKKSDNALTVPIGVVYYDEGRAFVYVAKDSQAVKTMIETGVDDTVDIEVVSGLTADDQVIVNWSAQLQDKAAVNVTKSAEKITVNTSEDEAGADTGMETPAAADEGSNGETASGPDKTVYVETTSNVNVRKDPTTDSERLETAEKGTRFVKISDEAGGWTKIIYNDGEAYVSSEYVRECE